MLKSIYVSGTAWFCCQIDQLLKRHDITKKYMSLMNIHVTTTKSDQLLNLPADPWNPDM